MNPVGLVLICRPAWGAGPRTTYFRHLGSTGTLSWADPDTGPICVVLTTLYGAAVRPHPMNLVPGPVAQAVTKI